MHFCVEVILPPQAGTTREEIEKAVSQVLRPYSENYEGESKYPERPNRLTEKPEDLPTLWAEWADEYSDVASDRAYATRHSFWDWYEIGGRWSGSHITDALNQDKLQEFYDKLREMEVTVSSLQWGKQRLQPESQQETVDALWREMFPESGYDKCPLFQHAGSTLDGDICKFGDLHEQITASRLIIAGPKFRSVPGQPEDTKTPEYEYTYDELVACYMLEQEHWNGLNHVKTTWDGHVRAGVIERNEELVSSRYKQEYIDRGLVADDWWVVTVDCHS